MEFSGYLVSIAISTEQISLVPSLPSQWGYKVGVVAAVSM